jgi:hypothetical protein
MKGVDVHRRFVSAIILAALVLSWGMRFEIIIVSQYPWVLDSWTGQSYISDTILDTEGSGSDEAPEMNKAKNLSRIVSAGALVLVGVLFAVAIIPEKKEETE